MQEGFHVTSCIECGQRIEFPREGLGLNVPCPSCGRQVLLSEESQLEELPPAQPAESISAGELQTALGGVIGRPPISVFYQFGMFLVAIFMVLLPLVYLAFVAAVGYGVYAYARYAPAALFSTPGGGIYVMIVKIILYLGPVLGGAMAVFFMFKPVLARRPKRADPIQLNPAQHPRLFQFVAHIADGLKVRMPGRIFLDCELNAGASLRKGWLSLFRRDLVLTVGLPLVSGLNTQQFAALIAHELGHCTQYFALRLGFVIRSVEFWFVRVVYQRDTWDDALEEWSNSASDWWVTSLLMAIVNLAVWFSRQVLRVLMLLGHAVSCFLSRQMEYHADACASLIAGSVGLERLLIRLRELCVLEDLAYRGLKEIWNKRHQLPDNLPDFLSSLESKVPADFHNHARSTLLNETAGLFATHPTAAQRIRRARRLAEPGIFAMEKPARDLFRDFAATARTVTARHYRFTIGLAATDAMLKPTSEFISDSKPSPEETSPLVSPGKKPRIRLRLPG